MDSADAIRNRIKLVPGIDGRKRHLMHPFNGRFHPVDHAALDQLVTELSARVDVSGLDYVLGFPEGGSIPAYAFARAVGRPVILASRLPLDLPDTIVFEQPAARLGTTQYLYGLKPGMRVMVFEDELTNGITVVRPPRRLTPPVARPVGVRLGFDLCCGQAPADRQVSVTLWGGAVMSVRVP